MTDELATAYLQSLNIICALEIRTIKGGRADDSEEGKRRRVWRKCREADVREPASRRGCEFFRRV
jgi:hypothetical protein